MGKFIYLQILFGNSSGIIIDERLFSIIKLKAIYIFWFIGFCLMFIMLSLSVLYSLCCFNQINILQNKPKGICSINSIVWFL